MNNKITFSAYLTFFIFSAWIMAFVLSGCDESSSKNIIHSSHPDIDQITEQIVSDPNNAILYFNRAKLYYEYGKFDHVILDMEFAMAKDSLNPDFYHLLADAYLDYYNSRAALNTMNKVLALYPERIASLLKMAELKHILQDYDGSILTVNEVVRIDPQNAEGYFMLGVNFREQNDKKRATNAFQTAVEMDSGLTDAWIFLGELYEENNDPLALKYFESAIISNPNSMEALHAKAYYLQNHENINQAQEIYRKIIVTDKNYSDAYLNSGILYLEADSLDKAYEQFDLLTTIEPTNHMGFYMRGIIHEKKGQKEAALSDYKSSLNLNKNDKNVLKAIEILEK